jgi:orotate phosphoribosyltransferase
MCIDSPYLYQLLDHEQLTAKIRRAKKVVSELELEFDSIAFRGMSGALTGPALAVKMKVGMILVRKISDGSHSTQLVEGETSSRKYLIVDDFVDSGKTVCEIIHAIKEAHSKAKCIGILSVRESSFLSLKEFKKGWKDTWKDYFASRTK